MSSQLAAPTWRLDRATVSATVSATPFPHLRTHDVLAAGVADRLLAWAESAPHFTARNTEFYRSSAFHVGPHSAPAELRDFFSDRNVAALRELMATAFATEFTDRVFLSVNRYGRGQGTLIHTDHEQAHRRSEFSFTHRFLLYLNRGWRPADGGTLGLFDGPDPTRLRTTIEPLHNSAVALEIGPESYHAVAAVRSGQRFSLNFTFAARERQP
jgi:Rps23 Pro-64 3,4-dihydroxylase Tpa1-like proline 4-hydroxylase